MIIPNPRGRADRTRKAAACVPWKSAWSAATLGGTPNPKLPLQGRSLMPTRKPSPLPVQAGRPAPVEPAWSGGEPAVMQTTTHHVPLPYIRGELLALFTLGAQRVPQDEDAPCTEVASPRQGGGMSKGEGFYIYSPCPPPCSRPWRWCCGGGNSAGGSRHAAAGLRFAPLSSPSPA